MSFPNGSIIDGVVTKITSFGAFIQLPDNSSGMAHISEVSTSYVRDINDFLKVGDAVKVMVLEADGNGRINLSIRRALKTPPAAEKEARECHGSFDDMLSRFMKESEEKLGEYKRSIGRRSGGYAKRG